MLIITYLFCANQLWNGLFPLHLFGFFFIGHGWSRNYRPFFSKELKCKLLSWKLSALCITVTNVHIRYIDMSQYHVCKTHVCLCCVHRQLFHAIWNISYVMCLNCAQDLISLLHLSCFTINSYWIHEYWLLLV